MNYSHNLSEQERQFLEAMARQFNFGGDTLTVFLYRFDPTNRYKDNSSLVKEISWWNRDIDNKAQKLQDELTKICQILENNGCQIEKAKQGRQPKGKSPWEQAFRWLWENKFIEWQQGQEKTDGIENQQANADFTSSMSPTPPALSVYKPQNWVGRKLIIKTLLTDLQGQIRLLCISGISGIGKTTLGQCLASKAWDNDPSFQWINLKLEEQSPDFTTTANYLLVKLGEKELNSQERNDPKRLMERLVGKLQLHRYWIQIDALEYLLNPKQPTEFSDPYWLTFLQHCLTETEFLSRLILTSQALPTAMAEFEEYNFWKEQKLGGLSVDSRHNEHLDLFSKNGITIDASSQPILNRIGQIYEGHPLVLQVIAKEILTDPFNGNVESYWQRYSKEFERVARELEIERVNPALYNQELQRQVRKRIETSLRRLPTNALDLLYRSSVYRRPVPETFWLAMIEDCSPIQQQEVYQMLGDRGLIEREGIHQGQFLIRMHNLIRAVGYDHLISDRPTWEVAERKAANLWLTAYKPDSNVDNLEKVRGYIEAFYHFCEIEQWEAANEILFSEKYHLQSSLGMWGYYHEIIKLCSKLLNNLATKEEIKVLNLIALAYFNISEHRMTIEYSQKVINNAHLVDDCKYEEAQALFTLASISRIKTEYEQAIRYYEHSLAILSELNDEKLRIQVLSQLGLVYTKNCEFEKALDYYQQSLALARKIKDRHWEGITLTNTGHIYVALGNYDEAIKANQDGLKIAQEIGDRAGEGWSNRNTGRIYTIIKRYEEAEDVLKKALKIFEDLKNPYGEQLVYEDFAVLYLRLKRLDLALEKYYKVVNISEKIGVPLFEEFPAEYLELKKISEFQP
ncbi:MAG: tetratricopeptide repeat protein [Dolichospermum sp.]